MKKQKQAPFLRRGISFGTIFMAAVTVVVLGLSAAVLPRLLGTADFAVNVGPALSALTLDASLTNLTLSDIPITNVTATPAPDEQTTPLAAVQPTATPVPTATPNPGGKLTLTIGGSINIDEAIRQSAYYRDSKKYDFTEMLMLLQDEMQSDLTLLTLENLTCDAEKVSMLNVPSAVMDMLSDAGVDVLALGHPKAYDKGHEALQATIQAAQERGMTTLGAYANAADATTPRRFTVNNVDVVFLHYTESLSNTGKQAIQKSGTDYALPTIQLHGTPDAMLADVREARQAGADLVIVSLNWGKVSVSKPTEEQKKLAQLLADAGADVIVGAGARVVQPVTWLTVKEDGSIRHTLCAWNLGSLLNESRKDGNVLGMLLQLQIAFDGNRVSFEKVGYTPTYIWRYKQDGQYYYRVAVSDQPPPDGMGEDQAGYMQKALRNLQNYLGDSPVTLRTK